MKDPLSRLSTALSGRYSIEREIGSGGMATVYIAHDRRIVAEYNRLERHQVPRWLRRLRIRQ